MAPREHRPSNNSSTHLVSQPKNYRYKDFDIRLLLLRPDIENNPQDIPRIYNTITLLLTSLLLPAEQYSHIKPTNIYPAFHNRNPYDHTNTFEDLWLDILRRLTANFTSGNLSFTRLEALWSHVQDCVDKLKRVKGRMEVWLEQYENELVVKVVRGLQWNVLRLQEAIERAGFLKDLGLRRPSGRPSFLRTLFKKIIREAEL